MCIKPCNPITKFKRHRTSFSFYGDAHSQILTYSAPTTLVLVEQKQNSSYQPYTMPCTSFSSMGFQRKLLFCDGASNNLSAIKVLTGFGSGAYGNKPLGSCDDIHQVKAWFTNPYTNKKVFVVICPSHQVNSL